MAFSTYNPSLGNGGSVNRSGYLNFNVDFNGSDTWQKRLVYVPSQNGTVLQNTWQEWNTVTPSSVWLYSGATWPVTGEPGTTGKTWSQILSDYPSARIRVTDSWLGIRVGEPYPDGYTEDIDAIKFGTSAGLSTFDFDALVLPTTPVITTPLNHVSVTVSNLIKVDWTDSLPGTYPIGGYEYQAFSDAGYTSSLYLSGWLTGSEIPTPATPVGDYYLQVRARDTMGNVSAWSNDASTPYHLQVIAGPVPRLR